MANTPRALPTTNRYIGPSPQQNGACQADITRVRSLGAYDIRLNQQQVNAAGVRVGMNLPDLQYTLNQTRYYVEYDHLEASSTAHAERILANDPLGRVIRQIFDK